MKQITDEHYDDLTSNATYRNEFARFLINLFCIGLGTWFGFIAATVFYMTL
ncbi:hypothetical protein [Macrococcoides bohemicum]|uniref:hypothetical protein n=1 Tax=Macrococcoides bohemicum TaxID=1903056 RepID=UPI00140484BE|nr:hypothetical protein [Macrococcus bohemicus]